MAKAVRRSTPPPTPGPPPWSPGPWAEKHWRRKPTSGLRAWDLVTPNRAGSSIGEFAVLLPGWEQIVLTKEVFVLRVKGGAAAGYDPYYLLWCLCLKAVRRQWQRVTLMQTNREDCGDRYREVVLPRPRDRAWAGQVAAAFRDYFTALATARTRFHGQLTESAHEYIASAHCVGQVVAEPEGDEPGSG